MVINIRHLLMDKIKFDLEEKMRLGEQNNDPEYKTLKETRYQFNMYRRLLNEGIR